MDSKKKSKKPVSDKSINSLGFELIYGTFFFLGILIIAITLLLLWGVYYEFTNPDPFIIGNPSFVWTQIILFGILFFSASLCLLTGVFYYKKSKNPT